MTRQKHFLVLIGLAGLLFASVGCSSNQSYTSRSDQVRLTGSIDRRQTREDDEEPARPVPPDPYKNVKYKGGRDPVTGAAPSLDGQMPAALAPAVGAPRRTGTVQAAAPAGIGGSIQVQPGDTLFGLARKHGVTVASLKQVNGLQSDTLVTGQTLTLPSR